MQSAKIFLFDSRLQKVPVYSLNLKMYLNAEVTTILHLQSVKQVLEEGIQPDVFICYHSLVSSELLELVKSDNLLFYSLGQPNEEFEGVEVLDEHITIPDLLKTIAPKFNVTAKQMADLEFEQIMPINNDFFSRLIYAPCDVYFKEGEGFKKVMGIGQSINDDFLFSLADGNQAHIKSVKRLTFTNSFSDQFAKMSTLLTNFDVDVEEKTEKLEQVMGFISRDFREGGMQPESIEIAETCIKAILETEIDSPLLQKLKENMLARSDSVRSVISFAVTFMGGHIVDNIDWILENPQENIATAAFYHDLIIEKEEDLFINSDELLAQSDAEGERRQIIIEHPKLMAQVLLTVPNISETVVKMVREHHGSCTGVGFHAHQDDIAPISKVFAVANSWAYHIYGGQDNGVTKQNVVEKLKEEFIGEDYIELINVVSILDIEKVDDIIAFLADKEAEKAREETNLGKELAELEETIKIHGGEMDEQMQEDLRAIGFYGEKAQDILINGGDSIDEEDEAFIKGIAETIRDVNQMIKGSQEEEDDTKWVIKGGMAQDIDNFKTVVKGKDNGIEMMKKKAYDIKKASVTNLMIASMKGSLELVKYYIKEEPGTLTRTDREGRSAIHFAAIGGNIMVCEYLLEQGLKVNQLDGKRRNPIFFTVIKNHQTCFDFLMDHDARVNQQSVGGVTLAMTAARQGRGEMLKRILGKGIPLTTADSNNKTIYDYAKGNKSILEIIKQYEK